jgi:hypothetical protein
LLQAFIGSILLYFGGGCLFQHVLSIPDALKPEVEGTLPWIACLFPMALVSGSAIGALGSRERFLTANLFQMFSMILSQVAPVIMAVFVSPSLRVVIPTVAIAQGLSIAIQLAYIYRLEGPISLKAFDRAEARKLLGYGGWVTVSSLISPLLVSADQFRARDCHFASLFQILDRTRFRADRGAGRLNSFHWRMDQWLAFVSFTLIQGHGRPDLTGKLHFAEILPFLGILWLLTSTLGLNGAEIAWSLRSAVDAFAMFWAAGMSRRVIIAAIARPAALLFASEAVSQFVGMNLILALAVAALVGLAAVWMAYTYCDDWRLFAIGQL